MKVELADQKVELKRELGLASATAIVVGNMIGSGIFMAPQSLAAASSPKATVIAWVITAVGSILLALSFAKLGTAYPETGGPIVYTRKAFGEFASFLVAWTYWIGAWVGNAAIITAFMSYFTYFFPVFGTNRLFAFLMSSAILWIFTLINIFGVKQAGIVGVVTTILKILPLGVFIVIAAIHFNPAYFATVSKPEVAGMGTIPAAIAITLWSFVGIECATIPAGEIKDPEKNIKKSTIYGTLITALIYLLISVLAIGGMEQATLANSKAPLADIIDNVTGGSWGGIFIALGAIIATLGGTSGWILVTGRSAYAPAVEGVFPKVFGKVHPKYRTPYASLIISGVLANVLLILNYTQSLTSAFDFMLLLATLAFIPCYSFTAAADIVLLRKKDGSFSFWRFMKNSFIAIIAFLYSIYAIYGTGAEVVMYGFILMMLGIPFYVYMKAEKESVKA